MKVCLYLEFEKRLHCSGIGSAINNQRRALELNNIRHTSNLCDDFDIIHLNVGPIGPRSLYLIRRMKKKGEKVVIHAHTTADDFRNSFLFSNSIAPFLKRYLTFYYNQADLVLCPSRYTKGVLEMAGVRKPIKVISNGIDTEKFQFSEKKREKFREEYKIDGITLLCVGHLFIRKGIETFVNVAKDFENRFIWVGRRYRRLEGPRVKRIISNTPDNITFIDYIDDIVEVYSGTDIFFFPSYCENQGIVLLEAGACRRPILVRDIEVYRDWLEDGVNCLKAKNDNEFRKKLRILMDDQKLRNKLGENAYKMSQEHSLKNIGAKLKEIYEELLNG
ncbi:MAG TPA: glycosyltransferase family 1 protein [Candidatus Altiarchaeales archaeon]|nr:glycosyltransferase family 1 protein [Candidatus Altiarchaeales archaeon]